LSGPWDAARALFDRSRGERDAGSFGSLLSSERNDL
jgi:hypothetical protein